jgi:hypothetical protein
MNRTLRYGEKNTIKWRESQQRKEYRKLSTKTIWVKNTTDVLAQRQLLGFLRYQTTPTDSFPCGHVKNLVCQVKTDNQQLTVRVGDAVAKVNHKMPQGIWTEVEYR